MGGGGFTGNNSVEWEVQGDNVRSHDSQPAGAGSQGRLHTGIDETPDTPQVQYFTVSIRLPRDANERDAFLNALRDEVARQRNPITVRLPIEDEEHGGATPGQIRVDWPSR
jgi:hypothetical protein